MIKFSVIIPTWNRAKRLNILLWRLAHGTFPKEQFEVIIVDGDSCDSTAGVINAYDKLLNIVYVNSGGGKWENPVRARNIGYKLATGEYSIMLDGDYVPSENILSEFEKSLAHSDLVYGFAIDSSQGLLGARAKEDIFYNKIAGVEFFKQPMDRMMQMLGLRLGPMPEWLFAVKTSIMMDIHGYDEDYLQDYGREDSDCFQRLTRHIPNYIYNPLACCIHIFHATAGPSNCRDVTRNHGIFEKKMKTIPFEVKRNINKPWGCLMGGRVVYDYRQQWEHGA